MYLVPINVRRLRYLLLPPHLERYLAKWVEGGVYGHTFDNVEDSLDSPASSVLISRPSPKASSDLIEPLLFWVLRQINAVMHDPANLGVPKHILFDELWKHLKTRQLLQMALDALKTGGKHLVGATLLTQSAQGPRRQRRPDRERVFDDSVSSRSDLQPRELPEAVQPE